MSCSVFNSIVVKIRLNMTAIRGKTDDKQFMALNPFRQQPFVVKTTIGFILIVFFLNFIWFLLVFTSFCYYFSIIIEFRWLFFLSFSDVRYCTAMLGCCRFNAEWKTYHGRLLFVEIKEFMWTIWVERIAIGRRAQEAKRNHTPQPKFTWKNANTFSVLELVSILLQ